MRHALLYGRVEPVSDGLLPWAVGNEILRLDGSAFADPLC